MALSSPASLPWARYSSLLSWATASAPVWSLPAVWPLAKHAYQLSPNRNKLDHIVLFLRAWMVLCKLQIKSEHLSWHMSSVPLGSLWSLLSSWSFEDSASAQQAPFLRGSPRHPLVLYAAQLLDVKPDCSKVGKGNQMHVPTLHPPMSATSWHEDAMAWRPTGKHVPVRAEKC